uniref:Uncharacterized protein n=1 Tax=Tetradesmus obliquus TaxID=3088 RepID=A0A383VAF9_TETOB|eukprot:jgi/Sobl393_1/18163/SZX62181.1
MLLLVGVLQLACLQAAPAAVATPTTGHAPLRGMPIMGRAPPMIGSSGRQVRGATFLVMPGLTVKLQDTDCGHANSADTEAGSPLQFCKVCGGPQKVARACLDDSDCAGYVMDDESCGYLKASVAVSVQAANATATLYCMAGTQGCEGANYDFQLYPGPVDVGDFSCSDITEEAGLCFVPGGVIDAAAECTTRSECSAFVTGSRNGVSGAYLKSNGSRMEDNTVYGITALYRARTGLRGNPESAPTTRVVLESPARSQSPRSAPGLSPSPSPSPLATTRTGLPNTATNSTTSTGSADAGSSGSTSSSSSSSSSSRGVSIGIIVGVACGAAGALAALL